MKFANTEGFVTGAENAEVVATLAMPEEAWAYVPIVTNGKGERAQCVPFPTALGWALDNCREARQAMVNLIDAHARL